MPAINCWRTRCIDQQQQQQHSVASAILATTQQSVWNIITLIIAPTFRSDPRFVCGDKCTWNECGIFIMRSWKMDRGPWINIYGTILWSGDEPKDWQNIVSCTAIFTSYSVRSVYFIFLLLSGLFCCVLAPGTLAFHLRYTLVNCDCLVYSVSQSLTT